MRSAKPRLTLTTHDRELLSVLARYRIITRDVARLLCYQSKEPNKVSERLSKLTRHNFTRRYEIDHPHYYFTLGKKGRAQTTAPRDWTRALKSQAFKSWYGALLFCCCGPRHLPRLTEPELHECHPDLVQSRFRGRHYYVRELDGQEHLSLIRIDHGSDPALVIRRTSKDVLAHLQHEAFAHYMRQGHFLITIVTTTPERKRVLDQMLHAAAWPEHLHLKFLVAVRPQLAMLANRA